MNRRNSILLLVTTLWLATAFIIPQIKSIGINTFLAQTAINVASAANGGIASASSELSSPSIAIDGVRNWATSGAWKDTTPDSFPDWLQVDFSGSKTINEIVVYGVRDDYSNTADPTIDTVSSIYTLISFDVQYWTGSNWQTVPSGSITNNNKVVVKISFAAITTTKIRVVVNNAGANYSRVVELEAWSSGSNPTPNPTPTSTPTPNSTPTPTVSATPTPSERTNVALASNGGVASASSELSAASIAIDGVRNWATTGAWKDTTPDSYSDWLQVNFNGSKTINEIDVFAVRDDYTNATDPTEETTFTLYGITDYNVQYWNGANWTTVPGGNITANNKVWKKITFASITTTAIRVVVNNAQANYSRIVELEAWSGGTSDIQPPLSDNTLIGSIDYVNANPTGISCNFNDLLLGAVYLHIICQQGGTQYAKFSSPPGSLKIANEVRVGVYSSNFLQTTYPSAYFGNLIVEFYQPARNLTFSAVGVDGGTFKVDVYQNNAVTQVALDARCGFNAICYKGELSGFNNVTKIVIHSINDPAGLGCDDFNFDIGNPTPTPTPPNRRPEGYFERINDGHALGYAFDPDNPNTPVRVRFYIDSPLAPGVLHVDERLANLQWSGVGNGYNGFNWRIPDQYRDGREHRLYVYAIDLVDTINMTAFLPPTEGRTFTLGTPKVQSVTLESKINCTNLPNPTSGCLYENLGNGNPGTKVGLKIFPDKAQPTELIDRGTVRVKATVGVHNIWVYSLKHAGLKPCTFSARLSVIFR
jgi:hypothetical protein